MYGEQLDTYGFADSPESEIAADYTAPQGLLLVGYTSSGQPVGCGGYRTYDQTEHVAEVRKMYVQPDYRGMGLGRRILKQLERQATARGARKLILETGALNEAAIGLYVEVGYYPIPSYVPGRGSSNRAFAKELEAEG
ncbi:GNAT family N-acetyltransferase [Kribbella qitaiheensis]|uniref:GNAT family N-acetyltransferase n=1 Tax=Kribbella qitaiheensis TaxID=1544730 RepID=A0A7G6X9F1_9ACTN|nr:GNAT family N-acetyltransferase [Kribbella qitaiheensis]